MDKNAIKGWKIIKVYPLSDGWKKVIVTNRGESCGAYMMRDKDVELVLDKEFIANCGGRASTNMDEETVIYNGEVFHVWSIFHTLEHPYIINE